MENIILVSGSELKEIVRQAVQEGIDQFKSNPLNEINQKPDDEYIIIDEVCKILKISKPSVFNYRKRGIITFYRIGRRVFYKKSEILSSLKKVTQKYDY